MRRRFNKGTLMVSAIAIAATGVTFPTLAHAGFFLQEECETTVIIDSTGLEVPNSEITECTSFIIQTGSNFSPPDDGGGGNAPPPDDIDGGSGSLTANREGQDWCPTSAADIDIENAVFTITANVSFEGTGATSANITAVEQNIESHWTRTVGAFTVSTDLIPVSGGTTDDTIRINISNGELRGEYQRANNLIRLGNPSLPGATPAELDFQANLVQPHEFGHALGLGDRYTGNNTPMPRSHGTLMGDPNGSLKADELGRLSINVHECEG